MYDFSNFDSAQFNAKLPKEFKTIVKCWVVNLVDNYKNAAVSGLIQLTKGFEITEGFKDTKVKSFVDFIEFSELNYNYKRHIVDVLCNFFDYADLDIAGDYLPSLIELKNKNALKRKVT
ncbi:hypothetical protein ACT7DL_32610 [Bacillus paranthracis]